MLVLLMFKYHKITRYILIPLVWRYYISVTNVQFNTHLIIILYKRIKCELLGTQETYYVSINSVSLYQINKE